MKHRLEEEDKNFRSFKFDQILSEGINQTEVFDKLQIGLLLGKVIEGYNATVFAYGQTSSGKTYTMEGYEYQTRGPDKPPKLIIKEGDNYGLVQRSLIEIYKQLEQKRTDKLARTTISCSFLQIYNEMIYDLLNNQGNKLRIRWNKEDQFTVENLYSVQCATAKEAIEAYDNGIKNRIMASHKLNISSSRSHTIFTITVKTECMNQYSNVITGKMQLVDLAGSEKVSQTGNVGKHFKESVLINQSLLSLRKIILTLADNRYKEAKTFVPYRDSKLTSLLKHCLGGNSFCLMVR